MAKTFVALLVANVVITGAIFFNYFSSQTSTLIKNTQLLDVSNAQNVGGLDIEVINNISNIASPNVSYQFDDPVIAYYLLQKLDIYENGEPNAPEYHDYTQNYFGTSVNDNYCDERMKYFVSHPESVFDKEKKFMSDYPFNHRLRNVTIPSVGQDLHPDVGFGMDSAEFRGYSKDLSPAINIFFTNILMCKQRLVGKHFSCLTQISNHCPGHESLYMKDSAAEALVQYAKQYKARPQCFNTGKFFPETWVLTKLDQCQDFFNRFNSLEYFQLKTERNIVYIRKIGANVHRGNGVFPVNDEEEQYIRNLYENGTKCGKVAENNLVQTFIHNPLLIANRKFHFRVFMYIASTNPFITYYHDGYLRISFQEYDTTSTERGTFVTNLGMTEILFQDKEGVGNRSAHEIKGDSYFFYPQFHKYLTEQGLINDPNWLDNHLRIEMKKAMVHIVRMAQSGYWKKSSVSELYGIDFMMDENLGLWFIEGNSMPLLKGWDTTTTEFFDKMILDVFEISFGLLRSRTKRIVNYINDLIRDKEGWALKEEDLDLINLKERREEFKSITMNRFEPEFEPSSENSFSLIVNENFKNTKRYLGLLEKECL